LLLYIIFENPTFKYVESVFHCTLDLTNITYLSSVIYKHGLNIRNGTIISLLVEDIYLMFISIWFLCSDHCLFLDS
jgi:hypothetical protein